MRGGGWYQRRMRRVCLLWFVLGGLLAGLVLSELDQWIFRTVLLPSASVRRPGDWQQLLRVMGYLPTWLALGAALALGARGREVSRGVGAWRAALLVVFSGALGGLLADTLKPVIRRSRPGLGGEYHFDWPMGSHHDPFGMPSSHAAVAFGVAWMVVRLWPRAGWVALPLAVGCGVGRLLAGAHYATDVYVAAWLSYAVAWVLWKRHGAPADWRGREYSWCRWGW